MWRQAHETRQGLAETREDIVGEKIAELIRVDLVLEHRLKNHPSKPLTWQEKQALLDLTKETDDAVWEKYKGLGLYKRLGVFLRSRQMRERD